ncbi:YceI family protein [Hyphococcus formosus]|uniref:YceI family protein n=1 Tax=Hyphococcus formosus TaxID=3143534 RepID=UPI00398B5DF5
MTFLTMRNAGMSAVAAFAIVACGEATTKANAESPKPTETPKAEESTDAAPTFDAVSGTYVTDPTHRYITFSYLHQGLSRPMLRWREWEGTLDWNAENPTESSVDVTIDATSIDSGVDVFDGHLNGDKFFNTAENPEITFVSTDVKSTGATTGEITGDLTMMGVTKPVTLDVVYNTSAFDERNNVYKIGFSGTTQIKRSDFGLGLYVPYVGDEVDIQIETEFNMAAE